MANSPCDCVLFGVVFGSGCALFWPFAIAMLCVSQVWVGGLIWCHLFLRAHADPYCVRFTFAH